VRWRLTGSGDSEVLPPGCRVTILADRGFADHKLFAYLADLGFAYVIRLGGNIHVTDASGETRTAANWIRKSTPEGKKLYRLHKQMPEPVFGIIGHGLPSVSTAWD
jgi:hypothetical protein